MSGWDDRVTAGYYEAFCRSFSRYAIANRALVKHAQLAEGQRVLDVGAGTGRTTEMILGAVGESGSVVAVEPAGAMRRVGQRRLADERVVWRGAMPGRREHFDRILCGAGIWQFRSLEETVRDWAGRLVPGGALAFNMPALYLMEPDWPGEGEDPWLTALPGLLTDGRVAVGAVEPRWAKDVSAALRAAGLRGRRWRFRVKLTQAAYAAWLKIPVTTEGMMPGVGAEERARRIDAALTMVDGTSWKWERWIGWTAWKS